MVVELGARVGLKFRKGAELDREVCEPTWLYVVSVEWARGDHKQPARTVKGGGNGVDSFSIASSAHRDPGVYGQGVLKRRH